MTYTATIRHDSISSARTITVDGDLNAAKRAATAEFKGDMQDYQIVISDDRGNPVAARRIGDRRWRS